MKRRSEISCRESPRLRSSSARGFSGLRNNRHSRADAVRSKRVKFSEHEVELPSNNESSASYEQHEAAGSRRSDAPKTSEYAFFKKLKKDVGCSGSSVGYEEGESLKIPKPSGSTRDFTTKFKDNFEKIKSSIHVEKGKLNSHDIFSPLQVNTPKNLEAVVEERYNNVRYPFLSKTVNFSNQNLFLSPLGDASERSGSENVGEDVFSQKRKRIQRWVAETSVPENENLHSKGYDLVSVLLNRLFSDQNQSKRYMDTEATPMRTDTKYSADKFLHEVTCGEFFCTSRIKDFTEDEPLSYLGDICKTSRERIPWNLDSGLLNSLSTSQYISDKLFLEDNCNEKSYWTKRGHTEADPVWYLGDNTNKTKDMISLNSDTRISNSPSVSHAQFQFGHDKSYFSDDNRSKRFFSLRDPYYYSDLEVYECSLLNQIEQNEFLALGELDYGRRLDTLLLSWDFTNSQGKGDLNHTTCDKEINLLPWYNHSRSLDNNFKLREPISIPLNSECCSEITLFPYSDLEKNRNWDSRFSEEDNLLVPEPKQYSLPFSYIPKCLDINEDRDTKTSYEIDDRIALQRNDWVISNILGEKKYSDSELLPSGHDLDISRELQSPQEDKNSFLLTAEQENLFYRSKDRQSKSFCTEDTTNIRKWLSIDLHNPFKKEMARPILLNSSSSCLPSEEGNYYDDCEML